MIIRLIMIKGLLNLINLIKGYVVFASNLKLINAHNYRYNNGSETFTIGPTRFAGMVFL